MNKNINTLIIYETQIETTNIENYKKEICSLTCLVITQISWHTIKRILITEVKEIMHCMGLS